MSPRTIMEWIKCSDRMPTDTAQGYLTVLKNSPTSKPRVVAFVELADWDPPNSPEWVYEDVSHNICSIAEDGMAVITHWMPYPDLPEELT